MIGHDANSETSHGAIARGARLSMLEGGTELFLQSDQGATRKELNSPHARPIGLILARGCDSGFGLATTYAPCCPDYVVEALVPQRTPRAKPDPLHSDSGRHAPG